MTPKVTEIMKLISELEIKIRLHVATTLCRPLTEIEAVAFKN